MSLEERAHSGLKIQPLYRQALAKVLHTPPPPSSPLRHTAAMPPGKNCAPGYLNSFQHLRRALFLFTWWYFCFNYIVPSRWKVMTDTKLSLCNNKLISCIGCQGHRCEQALYTDHSRQTKVQVNTNVILDKVGMGNCKHQNDPEYLSLQLQKPFCHFM